MLQVVQARCPHCRNVLRIPEDWLSRSMRCKQCRKIFQAQAKVPTSVPVAQPAISLKAAPVPVAQPAVALKARPAPIAQPALAFPVAQAVQMGLPVGMPPKPPAQNPFGFDEPDPPPAPSTTAAAAPSIRKRGNGLPLFLMFFFLFFMLPGTVGFVMYAMGVTVDFSALKVNAPAVEAPTKPLAKADGARTEAVRLPSRDNADGGKKNTDSGAVNPDPKKDSAPPKTKIPNPKTNVPVPPPLPKKDPNRDSPKKEGPKKNPPVGNELYPRRALLINVNHYLMFNPVLYGSAQDAFKGGYAGSSTAVLRDRLTRLPMNFPATQVTELSDGIPAQYKAATAHSTQKSVLESTITDFVAGSREQDRILIFFAGHAANIDDVSYLVPIEGNKDKVATLVPLKWVYEQLAKCKAQQKILILDVFRFSPSRGFELPSPGEGDEGQMPEGFDKDLLNPPAGVQVWSSCIKGQSSIELDGGSAFMQALSSSMQGGGKMAGIATPAQPIHIEDLVADVNERLKKILSAEKRTQVSRLTGKAGDNMVAYNAQEPLPATLVLKAPTPPGGEAAGAAAVESILEEVRVMPPVRDTRAGDLNLLRAQNLPAFSAKIIDAFKADGYQNITDLQNKYKTGKEAFTKDFPLRAAFFDTLEALRENDKVKLRETLTGPINPKTKAAFRLEQAPMAIAIFNLENALKALKEADDKREAETSKRWQANFDYIHARLLARLMYLYEYNYTIGRILADDLPELAPGQSGWRVGITGAKLNVPEPKAKAYSVELLGKGKKVGLWKRIQTDYPDTPWALLAQRESMIALGLAWKGKSD